MPSSRADTDRLLLRGVGSGYGSKQVVFDVDLAVPPAKVVVLLGHNGAGKSTLMSAAFGFLGLRSGEVLIDGRNASSMSPRHRVESGMSHVPSDDFVFADLTVAENLTLGGLTQRDQRARRERLDWIMDRWSVLSERTKQLAGTMSGGQRRMLSLGIALMSSPSLLLLDEPSLGLAPNVVDQLFADLRALADSEGLSVLLIEQSVAKALTIADDVYVMRSGRIIEHQSGERFREREALWDLF